MQCTAVRCLSVLLLVLLLLCKVHKRRRVLHRPDVWVRHCVKLHKVGLHVRPKPDPGALVAHLVAIVGRGEDGDALAAVAIATDEGISDFSIFTPLF